MSTRLWISIGLVAGVAALSGCVVVPNEPAYGYGYGYGHGYGAPYPAVRVAPPPVVVVPPPRHRHWGYWGYGERGGRYVRP
ncbi:MAG TPA: hypothetical protein VFN64_13160 [Burkholderiaceae bacterium]|nr:hypothetical protein [Burkholderiaceae bacterium]